MKALTAGFLSTIHEGQAALATRLFSRGGAPDAVRRFEEKFAEAIGSNSETLAVNSARTALVLALRALGVGPGDEVLVQAYTCITVPAAVRAVGATPVFVDVAEGGAAPRPGDFLAARTNRTKVAILQSTLGRPAPDGTELRKAGLQIIEDLAHRIAEPSPAADVAIYSLGRDKVVSAVAAGVIAVNSETPSHENTITRLHELRDSLPAPDRSEVRRALTYALLAPLIRRTYIVPSAKFGIGKLIMAASKRFHLFPSIISTHEKSGGIGPGTQLAPELAELGRLALRDAANWSDHRRTLAKIYRRELAGILDFIGEDDGDALRVLAAVSDEDVQGALRRTLARRGIYLGDWYDRAVAPKSANPKSVGYRVGMCVNAERLAARTVNLPNHAGIGEADALRVCEEIRIFFGK